MSCTSLCQKITFILILLISEYGWAAPQHKQQFVIITQTYNSGLYIEKYFYSLSQQKYSQWKCILINDGSTDDTAQKIAKCVKKYKLSDKVAVIHNSKRQGLSANLSYWIRGVPPETIVVLTDDSVLYKATFFETLSSAYKDPEVWATYGYLDIFSRARKTQSLCKPFPNYLFTYNLLRKHSWTSSRTRTFYAKLFQSIQNDDLKLNGQYIGLDSDKAVVVPILEMSTPKHIRFITDDLLLNGAHPTQSTTSITLEKHQIMQYLQTKQPYRPIEGHLFAALYTNNPTPPNRKK